MVLTVYSVDKYLIWFRLQTCIHVYHLEMINVHIEMRLSTTLNYQFIQLTMQDVYTTCKFSLIGFLTLNKSISF